jgi:hypothetical protein
MDHAENFNLYISTDKVDPANELNEGLFTKEILQEYLDWPEPREGQRRAPEDPNDKLVIVSGPEDFYQLVRNSLTSNTGEIQNFMD